MKFDDLPITTTCLFCKGAPSGTGAVLCCSARSSMHVSICATMRRSISRCALSRLAAIASISSAAQSSHPCCAFVILVLNFPFPACPHVSLWWKHAKVQASCQAMLRLAR